MTQYLVRAVKNPCGVAQGSWYNGYQYTFVKPTTGMSLNDAFKWKQKEDSIHGYREFGVGCRCVFEVEECADTQ